MNLSIPDAAVELSVSETRLRRTLLESSIPTLTEMRRTRTGVRKTTVLAPETIAQLHALFAAATSLPEPPAPAEVRNDPPECPPGDLAPAPAPVRMFIDGAVSVAGEAVLAPRESMPTVPVAQFNALLYQHNVLREELARVSEYLDGCDHLLGEMVRTISALEERTRQLEPANAASRRTALPFSGALRAVSSNVQNALFARAAGKSMLKSPEVYYGTALASGG